MSALEKGDRVFLIGPSFLQLNIAKYLKNAGLIPMVVAPQTKIDNFVRYVNDESIVKEANIGLPDPDEPYYGEVKGVVFCSEDAVFGSGLVDNVLGWGGYVGGGLPQRVVCCAPISTRLSKDKAMGWMPILNNDKKEKDVWSQFIAAWKKHPINQGSGGTLVRFGALLGGSIDGPPELEKFGLDEAIYKMSLENYRDLKERSFDRLRLGAQILAGDSVNPKPPNQEKLENSSLKKGEYKEVFRSTGGYPEQDRSNRHTVANAVAQALMRNGENVPKEFTVLSKCVSAIPSEEEWDELFSSPGAARWPDPFEFDPDQYDWTQKE